MEALGADGINLDFEALAPEDASPLVMLAAELRTMLHRRGRILTIDVTFGDPGYDLPRLARAADGLVLMAYDEHHGGSAPGPIASRRWLEERVRSTLALVPRDKLVVALGAYAMAWHQRGGEWHASSSSVPDALTLAATIGATPSFRQGNLHFAYDDAHGRAHEVWCLDAASIADARGVLARLGVTRTGLWRIGTEDPSTWSTLDARSEAETLRALARIEAPAEPHVRGHGELIVRTSVAVEGSRHVALDAEGLIERADLTTLPSPPRFERMGATESRQIVLTFDDGPDPEWTPRILEVLAAAHAPATFFAVGAAAAAHPDLVRRLVREGHTVASHTYDHPHMDALDARAARRELDRTARVLEALTGHEIRLYRAPYTALFDLTDPRELAAHSSAFDAGYLYVAASIDPHDWETRTAAQIADAIVRGAEEGGHVVVLHDGGGDRSRTVRGLALALPVLRERGYEVVSLETYAGLPRGALTPPLPPAARALASVTGVTVHAQAWGTSMLSVLFAICTALAALRVLGLAALVLRDRSRRVEGPHAKGPNASSHRPLVTVIVPAYNESRVIERSVRSLLAGQYRELEILVVDDGSRDGTSEVVARAFAEEPRVRLLRKTNGGKASAANVGIREARGEIVVAVDADTVVAPEAIRRMVAHFVDPRVTAVCGNVEVGNVRSMLTAFQAIEYVTSQNFDRRAFAALNCIAVVPGALGAWRREAVLRVGGYGDDTLVEDADLTLSVLRAGGVITYEAGAIARTEAPESLGALWKQRLRWTLGTYQCLAKHRAALGTGTLGWIAMPNALVFQVLFPLLSPIGDLALLLSLGRGHLSAVASGYLGFLLLDLVASIFAFILDRKPLSWLPLLLVQRFSYRQFLYLVALRAMLGAVAGTRHGWRKLERTGTVDAPVVTPTPLPPRPESGAVVSLYPPAAR